jgi:hypothetical protein
VPNRDPSGWRTRSSTTGVILEPACAFHSDGGGWRTIENRVSFPTAPRGRAGLGPWALVLEVPLLMDGELGYILTVKRSPEPS